MKHLLSLILIISILSCQSKLSNEDLSKTEKKYGTETKIFGDSLKVIYEYKGDTVIQERIDIKGSADDGWDSSIRVVSVWSSKIASDLNCSQILELKKDSIRFRFCTHKVLSKVEKDIEKYSNKPWRLKGLQKLKEDLTEIKNYKKKDFSKNMFNLSFDWLKDIEFYAFDDKSDSKITKVLLEKYKTNFSGGTNYYLVNIKNDTIANYHFNEWIR